MRYLFTFIILSVFFSCKSKKEVVDTMSDPDQVEISLSKGACFGTCPVYTLNVFPGGKCEFIGKLNTSKKGTHVKQLDKNAYKSLLKAFEDANYFSFQDMYESEIADLPSVAMSFRQGKNVKTVVGKRERPEAVHKLQFLLESIADNDEGWTLSNGKGEEKEEDLYDLIKSEIVIKTKNGGHLARWFDKMRKEHSVRIVKKLTEDHSGWLISYDKHKYTPEEILSILKRDENVVSAEFNKELAKR